VLYFYLLTICYADCTPSVGRRDGGGGDCPHMPTLRKLSCWHSYVWLLWVWLKGLLVSFNIHAQKASGYTFNRFFLHYLLYSTASVKLWTFCLEQFYDIKPCSAWSSSISLLNLWYETSLPKQYVQAIVWSRLSRPKPAIDQSRKQFATALSVHCITSGSLQYSDLNIRMPNFVFQVTRLYQFTALWHSCQCILELLNLFSCIVFSLSPWLCWRSTWIVVLI